MARVSRDSAPEVADYGVAEDRSDHFHDHTVNFTTVRQHADLSPLLKGLPGDSCQCLHWGYMTAGRMTVRYADHEEVIDPGDVFYMPPGHVPAMDAGSQFVMFSPSAELAVAEAALKENMQRLAQEGEASELSADLASAANAARQSRLELEVSMGSVRRTRQRLLGSVPVVSAMLLVIGSALTPKGLDQLITSTAKAVKVLPIAAAHTDRLYVSNLLILFGLGALGVSFAAIATLVRGRGAVVATAAAALGGFGCFCGALGNVLAGFNLAATVAAHVPQDAAERYLVTTFTSTVGRMMLVSYLAAMLVGAVLMADALWRSGQVPRWLPLLFAIGLAVATFARPGSSPSPWSCPLLLRWCSSLPTSGGPPGDQVTPSQRPATHADAVADTPPPPG